MLGESIVRSYKPSSAEIGQSEDTFREFTVLSRSLRTSMLTVPTVKERWARPLTWCKPKIPSGGDEMEWRISNVVDGLL